MTWVETTRLEPVEERDSGTGARKSVRVYVVGGVMKVASTVMWQQMRGVPGSADETVGAESPPPVTSPLPRLARRKYLRLSSGRWPPAVLFHRLIRLSRTISATIAKA